MVDANTDGTTQPEALASLLPSSSFPPSSSSCPASSSSSPTSCRYSLFSFSFSCSFYHFFYLEPRSPKLCRFGKTDLLGKVEDKVSIADISAGGMLKFDRQIVRWRRCTGSFGRFQRQEALSWSPNSRALISRTPTKKDPQFIETALWRGSTHWLGRAVGFQKRCLEEGQA